MACWDAIEELEPDISTERLWAMTMDAAGVDYNDVTEALVLTEEKKS